MKSESGLWRDVLFSARAVVKREVPLTSGSLAEETGLSVKVASAWLSLLAKYGYLRRAGKEPSAGRWRFVWELTRFGVEYQPEKVSKKKKPGLRIAANPRGKQG